MKASGDRLTVYPYRLKPLVCKLKVFFRMCVSDYRIISRIEEEKVSVLIIKFIHTKPRFRRTICGKTEQADYGLRQINQMILTAAKEILSILFKIKHNFLDE
jgi:hypothetical protein